MLLPTGTETEVPLFCVTMITKEPMLCTTTKAVTPVVIVISNISMCPTFNTNLMNLK